MDIPKKMHSWYDLRVRTVPLYARISCYLLFSPFLLYLQAQPGSRNYPVQFNQFTNSYPVINPASMGIHDRNEVFMGYQRPVNGFSGVSTYFCNLNFTPRLKKEASENMSTFGLRFLNDNEGAYINRMRFYGMYAFHTRIGRRLKISGGLELGGMNFSVKSTPTTGGASEFKMDANAGIWLYNNDFHVGFSVNQLFNSKIQPLDEQSILATHVNFTGSVTLVRTGILEITPHVLLTIPYYSDFSIHTNLCALFYSKFITTIGWELGYNISFMLGIKDIHIYSNKLSLVISYTASTRKAALAVNYLEISLGYAL